MLYLLVATVDLLLLYQMFKEYRLYSTSHGKPGRSTVIVPLRGDEPALRMNVKSLKNQDHGDYRLLYVVDHDEVERQSGRLEPMGVSVVESEEICDKCSGKVKAIITGIEHSEGNVVVADSDTIYPEHWLSDMTSMLDSYQAVTVFSWPYPLRVSMRNLLRAGFWTLGFESQAIGGRFLWGGSMAFRDGEIDGRVIDELKGEWCDDCALTRISKERGWRMGYAAHAMPLNAFDERNLISWASRQAKLMLKYSRRGVYAFLSVALVLALLIVLFAFTLNWFLLTPHVLWVIKNMLRGRAYGRLAILPSLMSVPAIFFAILMLANGARSHSIQWRDRKYSVDDIGN
jgi:cellulose synthase/poly-beta-1,6-N-acetylglucosamine synthase-like glycosyltransferase